MLARHWFASVAVVLVAGSAWWAGQPSGNNFERAHAHNERGERYAHRGQIAEGLRQFTHAIECSPRDPLYRYNWAMTASSFRREAQALYGGNVEELLARCLAEFQAARDLAPHEHLYGRTYAEMFYMLTAPRWDEAYRAWEFCLQQPLSPVDREQVVARLARICMQRDEFAEAEKWLAQMTSADAFQYRAALERKLAARRAGAADVADAGMLRAIRESP